MKKTVVVLLAMAFVFTGSSFLVPDKMHADESTPSVGVAGPVKMSKKAKRQIGRRRRERKLKRQAKSIFFKPRKKKKKSQSF